MSPGNAEVVQRVMRRFADQDIEAALEDIDPGAVLDWSNSNAPDGGIYIGHAAWRDFAHASGEPQHRRPAELPPGAHGPSAHIEAILALFYAENVARTAECSASRGAPGPSSRSRSASIRR